jgi:hemolysin activation/secretion protein
MSLYVAIQGQQTGTKVLDSSENMSLGGANAVRAYPAGEASGPQGRVTTLELRWRVNEQWLITPFYDHGHIEKRTIDTNTAYSLQGAGLAATWTAPAGWTARTTYARRIGRNANANLETGKDNDGSLHKDRVWLNLSLSF